MTKKKIGFIDYLINNGGCFYPTLQRASNGFELMFVTNYLSHFYFTLFILHHNYQIRKFQSQSQSQHQSDSTKATNPTLRVVNISSVSYMFFPAIKCETLLKKCLKDNSIPRNSEDEFKMGVNYGITKALLLWHARSLDYKFNIDKKESQYSKYRKLFNVESVSLHPGVIHTNLFSNVDTNGLNSVILNIIDFIKEYIVIPLARLFFLKTVEQGCATTIRCVVMKSNQIKNGGYYNSCQLAMIRFGMIKKDYTNANMAWEWTQNLIKNAGFDLPIDL